MEADVGKHPPHFGNWAWKWLTLEEFSPDWLVSHVPNYTEESWGALWSQISILRFWPFFLLKEIPESHYVTKAVSPVAHASHDFWNNKIKVHLQNNYSVWCLGVIPCGAGYCQVFSKICLQNCDNSSRWFKKNLHTGKIRNDHFEVIFQWLLCLITKCKEESIQTT